jgi:murein DD-endopeptidase MepM/ murein hydrolase activator NlpD
VSRLLLFLLVVLTALVGMPPPSAAASTYRPPVQAPVVDGFRLPDGPYGAGNRGLEYATSPGTPVRAIGDGLVVFTGPVPGTRAVTVLHPDGLRSSYTHLATITVEAGEHVARGTVLGTSTERLHLGVRTGGTYLDPAGLFASTGVHLVPVDDPPPARATATTRHRPTRDPDLVRGAWGWLTGTGTLLARS